MNTRTAVMVAFLAAMIVPVGVFAQANDVVDELLGQESAQIGHTAYLVLTASGALDDSTTPMDAFSYAADNGLVSAGTGFDAPITFGGYSYLLMEAFGVRGGVMYRVFPGPRYAAREVVYQEWSRSRRPAGDALSGEEVVRITSVFLNDREE